MIFSIVHHTSVKCTVFLCILIIRFYMRPSYVYFKFHNDFFLGLTVFCLPTVKLYMGNM